ncbi:ERMES complex subunit [Knufia obscura]|uniref:Mitochondrial distribution and morphology protein 34 n=2 Tax=Knufia TaxID=430999 RepID=A0AAN8EQF2_9EURO|nr:ERMES complex subunit [Knufia obscura]KAK5949903.1 ERMES complex subunit [Knufia fluminis]
MAFNFNWAPLSGDPGFYKRAEELLTNAMNKNQKPAIIVDDIIVNELNLGDVPPDLEVVEISDIGVDKFRGTFKMSYAGNAFITIKTRVQANPLNTFLVTRPTYASPRPLAAAAGLTIPLQITLSDFKLSAIIILVFSRQKGLTIVFRNDPLESLKVSSTFDSIPFVANYLQEVIEKQLRTLFMDELPAIIHRMSLRLWVPEHKAQEEMALREEEDTQDESAVDPLASTPQDPVDSTGATLSPQEVAALSLDSHTENHSLFSKKNLLRLATLTDSHRTLSLFTPNIRDAVFRAWTGPLERGEVPGSYSKTTTPALSRSQSYVGSIKTAYTFDTASQIRPAFHSHQSSLSTTSLGSNRLKPHGNRKRKKRVVNLRRSNTTGEVETVIEDGSTVTDSTSVTGSTSDGPAVFSGPPASSSEPTADPVTPPMSPRAPSATTKMPASPLHQSQEATPRSHRRQRPPSHIDLDFAQPGPSNINYTPVSPTTHAYADATIRPRRAQRRVVNLNRDQNYDQDTDETPRASMILPEQKPRQQSHHDLSQHAYRGPPLVTASHPHTKIPENPMLLEPSVAGPTQSQTLPNFLSFITDSSNSQSIAERAWMMKMAAEVARRYEDERGKGSFGVPSTPSVNHDENPPPAYAR